MLQMPASSVPYFGNIFAALRVQFTIIFSDTSLNILFNKMSDKQIHQALANFTSIWLMTFLCPEANMFVISSQLPKQQQQLL